jgi:hypothetical protein
MSAESGEDVGPVPSDRAQEHDQEREQEREHGEKHEKEQGAGADDDVAEVVESVVV